MCVIKKWHWLGVGILFISISNINLVASDWEPVVPQERLSEDVSSGSITPVQFKEVEKISIQEILERKNVQNLLRNQFEMLGEYGETRQGLILQKTEDWERFGKHVGLSGEIFKEVYSFWLTDKTTNRETFLGTELKNIDEFFETNFSAIEEGILKNGETVNWHKLVESKGFPPSIAVILIAMYGIWWRRKKFENDDFGGFKSIYESIVEKFPFDWRSAYSATYWASDQRKNEDLAKLNSAFAEKTITSAEYAQKRTEVFEKFSKWNVRIFDFLKNRLSVSQETPTMKEHIQKIISNVANYTYSKRTKQHADFDQTLEEVINNLSNDEISAIITDEFDPTKKPNLSLEELKFREKLIEKIDYVTPLSILFPMKFAPATPAKEEMAVNLENLADIFSIHTKNQIMKDKYEKEVFECKTRFERLTSTEHYWRGIWLAKLKIAKSKLKEAQNEFTISNKKIVPIQETLKLDYEAYADSSFTLYEKQVAKLRKEHEKRISAAETRLKPFLQSYRSTYRTWAKENLQNETKISQTQLNTEIASLEKSAKTILQMKMMENKDREIRNNYNNSQKQKREEYAQKRVSNPAKENVIHYLQNLSEAKSQMYFSQEQQNILNAKSIQSEIEKLSEEMNAPSPYVMKMNELRKDYICNQYTFEEYLNRDSNLKSRYSLPSGWVIKDEWIRNKAKIGRNGDYWQQKHARYSQGLIATRSEYDPRKIKLLNELAQKAHQEMLNSYKNWEKYFRIHPREDSFEKEISNNRINQLATAETGRKKVFAEQIEVLEKEKAVLLKTSFETSRWLSETSAERDKNVVTNRILSAQIKADFGISEKVSDPQVLINHFSEVRENQSNIREEVASEILPEPPDPFAFNSNLMIAPALKSMEFYSTAKGQAKKITRELNQCNVSVASQSRISTKNPIVYERNTNGTYTAFSRETGEKINEESGLIIKTTNPSIVKAPSSANLLRQVTKSLVSSSTIRTDTISITLPEVSITAAATATVLDTAEKILKEKRASLLELGSEAQLEAMLGAMDTDDRTKFNMQQISYALANGGKIVFVARQLQGSTVGIHTFIRVEPNSPNARAFTLGGYNSNNSLDLESMTTNKLVKKINKPSDVVINKENSVLWEEISNTNDSSNLKKIRELMNSFLSYKNDREYFTAGQFSNFYSSNCNNFSTGLLESIGVSNKKITEWDMELGFLEDAGFGNSLNEMQSSDFIFNTEIR